MSTHESETAIRQHAGTVEESEVLGIPQEKAEETIEALQTDLASTYVLYHQLKKHHWTVEGAEFLALHEFLGDAAEEAELAADELAERIQALGGVPLSSGTEFEDHATITPEDADAYDIRTALEHDMAAYGEIIQSLREHIQLVGNLGDYTTEEILRDVLEDVEDTAHHIEHYLEDDTLVTEDTI